MSESMEKQSTNEIVEKAAKQLEAPSFQSQIVWRNVLLFALLHVGCAIGLYQFVFVAQWKTLAFTALLYVTAALGVTMGVHRLWAHRSYRATMPLRVALMLAQTVAFQNDIIEWVRDHRGHHKWSDTDADPHNASRGFFFSHMGWLLMRKHPAVIAKGRTLDLSDVTSDPVCAFQRRFYLPLVLLLCFVLPAVVPAYGWGEHIGVAFYVCSLLRYTLVLHATWMVNSAAHAFGNRPYDRDIKPRQNFYTAFVALGEGWHNYHHSFPFDYKAAELPYLFNMTTAIIDACIWAGLASDPKTASDEMIKRKIERSGEAKTG